MTDTASETIRYALALLTLVAIGVAISRPTGSPYLWVPFGLLLGGLIFARPWARPVGAVVLGPYLLWVLVGDYGTRWGPTLAALALVAVAASFWRNPVEVDEPSAGDDDGGPAGSEPSADDRVDEPTEADDEEGAAAGGDSDGQTADAEAE